MAVGDVSVSIIRPKALTGRIFNGVNAAGGNYLTGTIAGSDNQRFLGADKDFSVSAWVFHELVSGTQSQNYIDARDASGDGWYFFENTNSKLTMTLDAVATASSTLLASRTWYHVAATIDRNGNSQLYIKGAVDGSAVAINSEVMAIAGNQITIGGRNFTTPANSMKGALRHVKIWNAHLSAQDILDDYNKGSTSKDAKNLVNHWKLTEDLNDSSTHPMKINLTDNNSSFIGAREENAAKAIRAMRVSFGSSPIAEYMVAATEQGDVVLVGIDDA